MGALDDLIKIKKTKSDDDLIKLLDEISVYEKLSVDKRFRDLKQSEVARKRCPLLAGFADGKLYETILADLASNVFLQIEGNIPDVLLIAMEQSEKRRRQMDILKTGITRVIYEELTEYDHESMAKLVVAVFTKQYEGASLAVIITKAATGYVMYHGSYVTDEQDQTADVPCPPVAAKGSRGLFTMRTYSILGNNGYWFGKYRTDGHTYEVMIGPDGVLYMREQGRVLAFELHPEELNSMRLAKGDPDQFAVAVTEIIERTVR